MSYGGPIPTYEVYEYNFFAMPKTEYLKNKALRDLFDMLTVRIQMTFSEIEFSQFRYDLNISGFELHEISRVPFQSAENVL